MSCCCPDCWVSSLFLPSQDSTPRSRRKPNSLKSRAMWCSCSPSKLTASETPDKLETLKRGVACIDETKWEISERVKVCSVALERGAGLGLLGNRVPQTCTE